MDRLVSVAVFYRTVELGRFASAARHFGISLDWDIHLTGVALNLGNGTSPRRHPLP